MKPVAMLTHSACLAHDTGPFHPENAARLQAVWQGLEGEQFAALLRERARPATDEEMALAHPARYVQALMATVLNPGTHKYVDGDTLMSAGTTEAVRCQAGAAIGAVDAVMEGWAGAAFAAVRPPGHHAERNRSMGFCFVNGAALAALHARARWGLRRVAVVDFDVHHGNGTQDIAFQDADFLYVSSHQSPCFPGTGFASEQGVADNIVNMPLPPGTDGPAFRAAWLGTGLPALRAFAPDLIVISAGFDAHRADPLADFRLETADFGWITDQIMTIADACCGGRVVSILEGGYDPDALAGSAALHVQRLMRQ